MPYCAPCNRSFVHHEALEQHLEYSEAHQYNSVAYCEQCRRWFVDNAALQQHLDYSSAHVDDFEPYCQTCNRYFVDETALEQHLENSAAHIDDSDDEGEPYCTTCDRYFADDTALEQHLDTSSAHNYFFSAPRTYTRPQAYNMTGLFSGPIPSNIPPPASGSKAGPVTPKATKAPITQSPQKTTCDPKVTGPPKIPTLQDMSNTPKTSTASTVQNPLKLPSSQKITNTPKIPSPLNTRNTPTASNPPQTSHTPEIKMKLRVPSPSAVSNSPQVSSMPPASKSSRISIPGQILKILNTNALNTPTAKRTSERLSSSLKDLVIPGAGKSLRKESNVPETSITPKTTTATAKMASKSSAPTVSTASKPSADEPNNVNVSIVSATTKTSTEAPGDLKSSTVQIVVKTPAQDPNDFKSSTPLPAAKQGSIPTTLTAPKSQENHKKDLQCLSCDMSFRTEKDLSLHLEETPDHHVCPVCTRVTQFSTAKLLENHQVAIHGLCILCNESFGNSNNLFEHDVANHNICKCCRYYFVTKDDLEEHIDTSHPNQQCTGCKALFETAASMVLHLELGSCPISRDKFRVKETALECLRSHFFADLEDKALPFQCLSCEAEFLMISEFVQHVESNTCDETMDANRPVGIVLQHLKSLKRLWQT